MTFASIGARAIMYVRNAQTAVAHFVAFAKPAVFSLMLLDEPAASIAYLPRTPGEDAGDASSGQTDRGS